jgi:protein-S-isoprenylcysteine O-methyltransferase Ste14
MLHLSVTLWAAYAVLAFGLRTFVQWRVTGRTGWNLFAGSKRPLERGAELLVASGLIGGFASAWLQPSAAPFAHPALSLGLYAAGTLLTVAAQFAMGREWRVGVDAGERTKLVAQHYAARVGRFVPGVGRLPPPSANHSAANPAT